MHAYFVVNNINGDETYFYSACAAHIYKDESHMETLSHNFIIDNWWYFSDFLPFPFSRTVGTGHEAYTVTFSQVDELHAFLLSKESLKSLI